jgi:DNA-binding NarL/FixJ family response regulator
MHIATARCLEELTQDLRQWAHKIEPVFGEIVNQWTTALRPLQNAEGRQLAAEIGERPRRMLEDLRDGKLDDFLKTYRDVIEQLYRQGVSLDRLMLMFNTWESYAMPFLRKQTADTAALERSVTALERLNQTLFASAAAIYHSSSRRHQPAAESGRGERLTTLTRRERQILAQIGQGYRTKEIALQLGVSIKTIEAHRTNIMRKLGVTRLAHLVRYSLSLATSGMPKELVAAPPPSV